MIAEATAILRESGPDALTSVGVAARLGVTQSAIYRHVRDMDELTTIACNAVVAELGQVMVAAAASPESTWGDGTNVAHFARRLVALIGDHEQAFTVIDRWRYDNGELGAGIQVLLATGRELIAGELERAFREDFSFAEQYDDSARAAQLAHAQLIIDDVVATARFVRGAGPRQRKDAARLLGMRLFAGWCGFVLDMTHRMGIPTPVLGGPTLDAPEYSSR